ncbi:MAG: A/G-specific adenine glycosylase [Saprospirales bacterium]|nr:A/G-specific adenine glycosylase [Saprospirales bacterium]
MNYPAEAISEKAEAAARAYFQKNLLDWHAGHSRPMPWKGERDPYKVWLSEIILQQTRVEQGLPYFEKFVAAYPTVERLAAAPLDAVLKLWEGLGYYSRARNMHATALYIATERDGRFPDTYAGLRALKGVGDYTAAAIASFAFDLPYAVLDGNVYRVLARFFGIDTPTDTPAARKQFAGLAQQLLDPARSGACNQAIMDFGATQCTPQQPACVPCPLRPHCAAFHSNRVPLLPRRSKTPEKRQRFFAYAVFYHRGMVWVGQRHDKDIWQNLYEFPRLDLPEAPADTASLPPLLLAKFFPAGPPEGDRVAGYFQHLSPNLVAPDR